MKYACVNTDLVELMGHSYIMCHEVAVYHIVGNFRRVFIFGYFEEHRFYGNKFVEIKCVTS